MNPVTAAKWKVFASMFIFGTIGLFVRSVSFPSQMIAMVRGVIGAVFLWGVVLAKGEKLDWLQVRKNLLWLLFSGAALGFNWIFLFEAYRYTSVAVATLCYYMAPILIIVVSPFFLRERLTVKKGICVVLAMFGMVCISGVFGGGIPSGSEVRGIIFGLAAAVLYASIVLMNKKIHGISAFDKTILQLGISAIVLLPYCLLTTEFAQLDFGSSTWPVMILLGIVHTGLAYFLYFGALDHVPGQAVAMISYVDPAVAVLASVLILREPMEHIEALGALLILGAALMSEVTFKGKK